MFVIDYEGEKPGMLPVETHGDIDQLTDGFCENQHACGVNCTFCYLSPNENSADLDSNSTSTVATIQRVQEIPRLQHRWDKMNLIFFAAEPLTVY